MEKLKEKLDIILNNFGEQHQQMIKERVFFKVDRTIERIENGYYKQI